METIANRYINACEGFIFSVIVTDWIIMTMLLAAVCLRLRFFCKMFR